MPLGQAAIVLLALILVGTQVVMARRYGWTGLAGGTLAAIGVIFGARAIYAAWKPWKPSPQDEFGFGHGFFLLFFTLGYVFIVLIAAIVLAHYLSQRGRRR